MPDPELEFEAIWKRFKTTSHFAELEVNRLITEALVARCVNVWWRDLYSVVTVSDVTRSTLREIARRELRQLLQNEVIGDFSIDVEWVGEPAKHPMPVLKVLPAFYAWRVTFQR